MDIGEACKIVCQWDNLFTTGRTAPVQPRQLALAVAELKRYLEERQDGVPIPELALDNHVLLTPEGVRRVMQFVGRAESLEYAARRDSGFDLERFVAAQAPHMAEAQAELLAGRKRTHWMWFVFPQLRGLGHSETARHFGLVSRAEAAAYLAHPVLGVRLRTCVELVLEVKDRSAHAIFGTPDDLKLRSCLTLFREVDEPGGVFARALAKYFGGEPDAATLELIAAA
jgi:uncharacterized protein (DUF1810 family)